MVVFRAMSLTLGNRPLVKIIEIEIGIAIEIENCCNAKMFDTDFDSDFDPENGNS